MAALSSRWEHRVPLQVLAGLHYLVLGGAASWESVDSALEEHYEFLRQFVAARRMQTNEVQRSWTLLPLFLRAVGSAEAVDVVELGASAGLNLVWDRYRYHDSRGEWGPSDAPLTLRGEERRPVPAALLGELPRVRSRVGIDRAPVDASSEEGARLLRSFVWAGQNERLERLDRAIEALPSDPSELLRGAGPELAFVSAGKPRGDVRTWGMRIYRPGGRREFVGYADYHAEWIDYDL